MASVSAYAIAGGGSPESPFVITNQEELKLISDFPSDCYVLGNDITLSGEWEPLCLYSKDDFSGEFDGRGYTVKSGSTALFKTNKGTIKNLNVTTGASVKSVLLPNTTGLIAGDNYGKISDCTISGKITVSSGRVSGAAAGYNYGTIENVTSHTTIDANSSTSVTLKAGGIVGENAKSGIISGCMSDGTIFGGSNTYTGGIAYSTEGKISNSYFRGKAAAGIAYSHYSSSVIENCYAAATTSYGIRASDSGTITNSFFDKDKSKASGSTYGKSTLAMKMKRTYTSADWDFDTVWGIDESINDGYPYLLREYPNIGDKERYTLNNLKFKNSDGETTDIPEGDFIVEVSATKNDNSKTDDFLIIAVYDKNDALLDIKYMSGAFYQNQTVSFASLINQADGNIGSVRVFVWDSVGNMVPLSNVEAK